MAQRGPALAEGLHGGNPPAARATKAWGPIRAYRVLGAYKGLIGFFAL